MPQYVSAPPELTEAGHRAYEQSQKKKQAIDASTANPKDLSKCVPVGPPRIYSQRYPFEIVIQSNFVVLLYEHMHSFRVVYLNESLGDPHQAVSLNRQGNSVARWDGNTLVVESNAFSEKTFLDDSGLPISGEQTRMVERFRILTDGTLEVETTIDDPLYKRPCTVRATFKRQPNVRLLDYVCGYGAFEDRYSTSAPRAKLPPPAIRVRRTSSHIPRPNLSGLWARTTGEALAKVGDVEVGRNFSSPPKPVEQVPFQPWAREWFDTDQAQMRAGKVTPRGRLVCILEGPVDMLTTPFLLQFVQTQSELLILTEANNEFRHIHLNQGHPDALAESYNGDSVGHWEDSTLVIDTVGLNELTPLLSMGGTIRHSEALHVVERMSLSSDGQVLTDAITLSDPKTFLKPWTLVLQLHRQPDDKEHRPQEFVCADGPLDLND